MEIPDRNPVRFDSESCFNVCAADRVERRTANVLERFLECGDLHCGFARIRCGGCGYDLLLAFFLQEPKGANARRD
jgi:hypothetical protein